MAKKEKTTEDAVEKEVKTKAVKEETAKKAAKTKKAEKAVTAETKAEVKKSVKTANKETEEKAKAASPRCKKKKTEETVSEEFKGLSAYSEKKKPARPSKKKAPALKKVLIVASEATPFSSSGGLGDVAGSLPGAIKEK